jgi:hypothetical protein
MTAHLPAHDCSNCGDPVVARRPSATGRHYCKRKPCQAAKQRLYRRLRNTQTEAELLEQLKIAFVGAVAHADRVVCSECGRDDAVDGWVHPTPGWTGACLGSGYLGDQSQGLVVYLKAVWPVGCPF